MFSDLTRTTPPSDKYSSILIQPSFHVRKENMDINNNKYYDADITDEDLETIKQGIIEAKKQGMLEGHLVELPYIIGQKEEEIKEWVSVDIFPDFESKRAKLVFSDNFGEEHCIHYMPVIKRIYLDKWKIEAFYPVDKYGEQVSLVNRYLAHIGCRNIDEAPLIKTQETAETLNVRSQEKVIKLCDFYLSDNEEILNRIIEADETGETVTLLKTIQDRQLAYLQHYGLRISDSISDNIISDPKRYYYGFRTIIYYLQYKVGVSNFNIFNSDGNRIETTYFVPSKCTRDNMDSTDLFCGSLLH